MATYAMSDIHGHYDEFCELLDKIAFGSTDQLYILGDIIDKGPKVPDMLDYAINNKPDNVHFLLGNHEDLARSFFDGTDTEGLWFYNGGLETLDEIDWHDRANYINPKLPTFLRSLKPYIVIEVNKQNWLLVHAGINVAALDPTLPYIEFNAEYGYNEQLYDLTEYKCGIQDALTMLWDRQNYISWKGAMPLPTVSGHTNVNSSIFDRYNISHWKTNYPNGIKHYRNRYLIDCGAAYYGSYKERSRLAALRLDDLKEFYVQIKGDTWW